MSGEDSEITILLKILGWTQYYQTNLLIQHFITSNRLNWKYYLKLRRGLGATAIYMNLYRSLLSHKLTGIKYHHKPWWQELLSDIGAIIKDPLAVMAYVCGMHEGNYRIAMLHYHIGKLREHLIVGSEIDRINEYLWSKYASQ